MINTKKCRICGEAKEKKEFAFRSKDVPRSECKSCFSILKKSQYAERKARKKQNVLTKTCNKCEEIKKREDFRQHPSTVDGLNAACKKCMSEYYKSDTMKEYLLQKKLSGRQKEILNKYRVSHSDKIKERRREIRTSFAKPIKIAEARMRSELRSKVHKIMGGKCKTCGEDRTERLCIDHVNDDGNQERLSLSGSFRSIASRITCGEKWKEKYQLLCFNCNRKKQLEKLRTIDKNNSGAEETKVCTQCKKLLPVGMFAESKHRPKRVSYCKDCGCAYDKRRRKSCLEKLGGKCAVCGETDLDVLEIDHVENDGAAKRKTGQDAGIVCKIYSGKRGIEDVQILCANCNAAKAYRSLKERLVQETTKRAHPTEIRDFSVKSLTVVEIPRETAKEFLNTHHYAGHGRSGKAYVGAMLGDEIVAVAKFAPVIRKEVATSMGMSVDSVIELDRFCIDGKFQKKNVASFILSRAVNAVKTKFPEITCAVSFADTAQGHRGTIYAACGWKKVGMTPKSYCYVGKLGNVVNKKTLYGRAIRQSMTEGEYVKYHEYEKVETPEKIKFVLKMVSGALTRAKKCNSQHPSSPQCIEADAGRFEAT